MPVVRGEEVFERRYDGKYQERQPPEYLRRKEPEFIEPQRVYAVEETRRITPEEYHGYETNPQQLQTNYKPPSDMEKHTIILEKAAPGQGFGIAVSGGLDNPHYETGDTAIIVSDVVEGSPADGLLRMNDVILSVNGVNVENVEHGVAVEALKNSGYSVTLVILRKFQQPLSITSTTTSSVFPAAQRMSENVALSAEQGHVSNDKEPRTIILHKQAAESYGLSLGTILFVKDLDTRGPAGRDGQLEPGDVILKINHKRVDDLSRPDAVTIMRNANERLEMVVLKNKDVPPEMPSRILQEPNVTLTRAGMVEAGVNGSELFSYKQDQWDGTLRSTATYSISSAGRRSDTDRDLDVKKDKKFHGEPHLISFHRTGHSLGIQVAGGNAVGIFAAAIKEGSPAQFAGLRVGDQILNANEIEFKDITREEAVLILLSLPDEVSLLVQYKKSVYERTKEEPGDSFYIKAQFQYFTSEGDELEFRCGEVFHVLDTMNGGTIGSWRAQRVLRNGNETEIGIIPNKCRAEQLAIAQGLEKLKGPQKTKPKSGTLKRKDTKTTPKKKQYQAADHLDETSFQLDTKCPAYERVTRREAPFVRPVVLLGPVADICRDKLTLEYQDKFTSPATFGRFDNKQSGIKLSAVRDNIASGKHSVLDVTPDGIEMLGFVGLEPIVIFLQPATKQLIKDLRHDLTGKVHSARFVKKLFDQAETLLSQHSFLFTAIVQLERNSKWFDECVSIIDKQQNDFIWMPEQVPQQSHDEDMVLARRSVAYDPDQSHLDTTTPGELDRSELPPYGGEQEVVVASATVLESEQLPAPAVPAYSGARDEVGYERDAIDSEERANGERERYEDAEQRRRAIEDEERREREFRQREQTAAAAEEEEQRRQQQRQQEEEFEYQQRKNEEREYQRQQQDDERERQQQQQSAYEKEVEQREYERLQYEQNRRGYDDLSPRDERKPYIPPGVKVLPGAIPPVVSLKKAEQGVARSGDDSYQAPSGELRESVQLRHVERDEEGERFDERLGIKVSDVFDISKDIQINAEQYRASDDERRQVSTRQQNTIQSTTSSTNYRTTTTTKASYQSQPRNVVVDAREGRRVENQVFTNHYPQKMRSQFINVDAREPQIKMEYDNRVQSEPNTTRARPTYAGYDDVPASHDRRPPPLQQEDNGSARGGALKSYSSSLPRPYGTSYNDYRKAPPSQQPPQQAPTEYHHTSNTTNGHNHHDNYQTPVPENASYHYGNTAYRNPTTDYEDGNREATRGYSEI